MMFINQFNKAWTQSSQSVSFFSKFTVCRPKDYNQMISFTGIFQRFASSFRKYFVTGRLEELYSTSLKGTVMQII